MTNKVPVQEVYSGQNQWGVRLIVPTPDIYLSTEKQHEKQLQRKNKKEYKEEKSEEGSLFPSISNLNVDNSDNTNTRLCSTGLTTRLLPFKNAKGEIEWAFTEDISSGNELDVFKLNPRHPSIIQKEMSEQKEAVKDINLTPVSSNSSNNESIISSESKHKEKKVDTPLTNTSSPLTPGDERRSDKESEKEGTVELENDNENDSDGEKTHQCPHCDSVFKIRGYLTRHLKKHALKKAYSCPFHKFSIYIDENNITHKCHPNGGFSRRDTYKTHLKSRHFKYPKGTKTKDRSNSAGSCSMCGEFFENSEIWCELHIEGGECRYLPVGFKGKSRIKNRLKKSMTKQQRRDMEGLQGTEYGTPFLDTPNSIATPLIPSNNMTYDHNNSNSPTFSLSSSIAGNNNISSANTNGTPFSNNSPSASHFALGQTMIPQFEQFQVNNSNITHAIPKGDDYDDEYCLDTDQLNYPSIGSYGDALHFTKLQGKPQIFEQFQKH